MTEPTQAQAETDAIEPVAVAPTQIPQPPTLARARLPRLDYEGDATHGLRVPELRVANATLSRTLGRQVDVLDAVTAPTADRWDAMAHIAWVIAKRSDPTAQLGLWTNATAKELSEALQVRAYPERTKPPEDEAAPTPTLDQLHDQAEEEGPTGPTVSPS